MSWSVETIRLQVLSSTEAEYCETANACKEILAQQRMFAALNLIFPQQYVVLVDNQSALALACGPAVHYQRTKHIALKYHFQRQLMLDGVIRLQHQATSVQVADILTKDLDKILHKKHRDVLFGNEPIKIISLKLPESQKVYCRRHNEEIERRHKTQELKVQLDENTEVNQEVLLALS